MIKFTIPGLRLVSEANERGRWTKASGRTATQRGQAATLARNALALDRARVAAETGDRRPHNVAAWLAGPLVVTVVRVAPTRLDSDNLVGSAKHVRDGVADALGINDRDERVTWVVLQRRGGVRQYAVDVTIAARETCPHCGAVVRDGRAA